MISGKKRRNVKQKLKKVGRKRREKNNNNRRGGVAAEWSGGDWGDLRTPGLEEAALGVLAEAERLAALAA